MVNKYNIFGHDNNVNKDQMMIDAHRFSSKYNDDFAHLLPSGLDNKG